MPSLTILISYTFCSSNIASLMLNEVVDSN